MSVTRKQVANSFNIDISQVKQINSMQLFINLWKGSVWEVTDGKRKLIKRV